VNPAKTIDILTLNSGSSSLKAAVFSMGRSERRVLSARITGIGGDRGRFRVEDGDGKILVDRRPSHPDHGSALDAFLSWFADEVPGRGVDAVGHRIVHGGPRFRRPHRVDEAVLEALRAFVPSAPDHLPQEIRAIEAVSRAHPGLPQIACFDTGFHRDLPEAARTFPLPSELLEDACFRYGFHGLSYEYITGELARENRGRPPARAVIAHLGNGASLVAVRDGRSVDTTMGFTPLGGTVMGTRPGDLDPGVLVHLLRNRGLGTEALNDLLNHRSGLLGISGTTSDMKELLDREADDPRAALAVGVFCHRARKELAAMAASLGGLEVLVFTGGIGEHAPSIRERIVNGLDFMGVRIDPERNAAGASTISPEGAPVAVRVMPTDEELMIARHTAALIADNPHAGTSSPGGPGPGKDSAS
jgi:acetate kinase